MKPFLNHIISFADVPNIDRYLERYKKAGFVVDQNTVRHAPGKRNGFVNFGPDYIEFCWVENQSEFNKKETASHKFFQRNPRPFGVAWESKNVDAFHKKAVKLGFKLKPTWSKTMKEANDSNPWWTFQDIPQKYLPGAWSFMLTYVRRDWTRPYTVSIGKNTIYGLTGMTFITQRPQKRAATWQKLLGGKLEKPTRLILGPHFLEWLTPAEYRNVHGAIKSPLQKRFTNMQEIALIHLVAKDIHKARSMLVRNSFRVQDGKNGFSIIPDKRDGFAFHVMQMDPKKWAKTRNSYRKVVFK